MAAVIGGGAGAGAGAGAYYQPNSSTPLDSVDRDIIDLLGDAHGRDRAASNVSMGGIVIDLTDDENIGFDTKTTEYAKIALIHARKINTSDKFPTAIKSMRICLKKLRIISNDPSKKPKDFNTKILPAVLKDLENSIKQVNKYKTFITGFEYAMKPSQISILEVDKLETIQTSIQILKSYVALVDQMRVYIEPLAKKASADAFVASMLV